MDDEHGETAIETFEEICLALRRKDPSITKVGGFRTADDDDDPDPVELTSENARLLGEALQGNPYVTSIALDITQFGFTAEDTGTDSSAALLLQFIRENQSLKKVDLSFEIDEWYDGVSDAYLSFMRRIILAMAECSTIEVLRLINVAVDPRAFETLMKTAQSLKELWMFDCDFGDEASHQIAAEGLGANTTLDSLYIETDDDEDKMLEPFVLCLGAHPCLRELIMRCPEDPPSRDHIDALTSFLHTSRTVEHLHLKTYRCNKETLEPILDGIHTNDSLTKVTIESWNFDMESSILFEDILKPKNGKNSIRELHLVDDINFAERPWDSVVTSILSPKEVDNDNGSKKDEIVSLDVLEMTGRTGHNLQSVFELLGNKATSIQLRSFRCDNWSLSLAGCDAMAASLPKLIYLKELSILNVEADVVNRSPTHKERLLLALKQNGSLHCVKITRNNGPQGLYARYDRQELAERTFFTDKGSHRFQLYCKRNHSVPSLVANARLKDDDDKTDRCLFPKLFKAAKQAPRTAPNSFLIGLLSLGDTVGRHHDGKRARGSDSTVSVSAARTNAPPGEIDAHGGSVGAAASK